MSYTQQYTELDGTWHAIGEDEHTVCGLPIPHGSGYGPLPPKVKAHCVPDVLPTGLEMVAGGSEKPSKPAAKATKTGGKVV